jgi:hypothetical protein
MGELLPPEIASSIINRMNPYLYALHSTMEYIWLDKNTLYIQIKGDCGCGKEKFFECSCQESTRIKDTITMLLKEDLNFINDVVFLKG